MTLERLVVVGGGPAGYAVAEAYRAAGGRAQVTLLSAEPHAPYERPPLSKDYLRGELAREELPIGDAVTAPANAITLRHAPVTAIDRAARTVELMGGDVLGYDALVLATGSEPLRPPIDGADLDGVVVLRTLDDADALRDRLGTGVRGAVVVGSGFIGCEAAASLAARGVEVTVVSSDDVPQAARLGEAVGRRIARWLQDAGVVLHGGQHVAEVRQSGTGLQVVLDGEQPAIDTDLVLLAAGARPRTELAEAAGLELEDGGVRCSASLQTSDPAIWAAGDIAVAEHPLVGRRLRVEHWGDALAHGEAIGRTLAGEPSRWEEVPGFWSTIGDHTLKWVAWGDGFDEVRLVDHPGGGWTAWYSRDGACVGVLTHEADDDGDRGRQLIEDGAPAPPT